PRSCVLKLRNPSICLAPHYTQLRLPFHLRFKKGDLPMYKILQYFRFLSNKQARTSGKRSHRPMLECLEDRTVPSTLSSITSNFTGTHIPAGDTLWFSSALKARGLGSAPVNVHVTDQVISFQAGGTTYTLNVPDSNITFSPTTSTGTTSFDSGNNAWVS